MIVIIAPVIVIIALVTVIIALVIVIIELVIVIISILTSQMFQQKLQITVTPHNTFVLVMSTRDSIIHTITGVPLHYKHLALQTQNTISIVLVILIMGNNNYTIICLALQE